MMADVNAIDHKDGVLRDVGGMISDPFETTGDVHQIKRTINRLGVLGHADFQQLDDLCLQ